MGFHGSALINAANELDVKFNTPYGEGWGKFLSETYITYKQEINSLAEIMGTGIRNTSASAYIPYCTNLVATAIITGSLDYNASGLITEHSELDVKYNTPYGESIGNIPNSVIIKNREHISGNANIELLKNHIGNEVLIPFMEGIHSIASVNENLSLDVVLGILQPPQSILTIDALQDTYTRQSRPYNNYGYLHTLAVGKASEGEFITYIDFDLTELIKIKDQAIISIDFHIDRSSGHSGNIDVYECFSSWSEGFLMWANTMYHSEDPMFSFTAGDTVDVTMLVKALMDSGKTKFKLMLKSDELSTFQSKESGAPPQLIVTYANPEWVGFIGDVTEYCSAVIRSDSRKVFHSMFNILHKSLQPSVAVLREKGLKEAEATIVNPLFGGRADILANSIALNSTAMIMNTSDLASSFDKNASEYSNIADILTKNRFHSFAEVAPGQAYDWKEHRADIKATASFADSFADILDKIFSHGSAYIKPYNEVPGAAHVNTPHMPSEATLTKHRNIFSEVTIGNVGIEDHPSEAYINYRTDSVSEVIIKNTLDYDLYSESLIVKADRSDYYSYSTIKHRHDIESSGTLLRKEIFENIAEALIRRSDRSDMFSNAFVRDINDIYSHGTILNADEKQIQSEAILRAYGSYDTPNLSTINELFHLAGGASILRHADSYLLNTAYIMIPDDIDHKSEAYLNKITTLENEAILHQLTQLASEAIVRRTDKHDLQAQAELLRISTIPSSVGIREISQIAGQAIIREEGVLLYLGTAFLNGWYPFDTSFYADIIATGNFKYNYATIRNNARVWTPPTTIGKLPRVWRWEDFFTNA